MDIQNALKTIMSDTSQTIGSKVELIAFLRRFSGGQRPLAHYACRGRCTSTILQFLKTLGFEEDVDYKLVQSKLDPEANQIKWKDLQKIRTLNKVLANLISRYPSYFDAMYVAVTTNQLNSGTLYDIAPTVEIDAESVVTYVDRSHFVIQILDQTTKIVKSMFDADEAMSAEASSGTNASAVFPVQTASNFAFAWGKAMQYLRTYFNEDGSPKDRETAPYILPLAVLELAVHLQDNRINSRFTQDLNHVIIFKVDPFALDLFRLITRHELVMWGGCIRAPLDFFWNMDNMTSESSALTGGNPLKGYFFVDQKTAETAVLDNKEGIGIAANSAIIHDDEAEDSMTPAIAATSGNRLWQYISDIYTLAYGCETGLSCYCRVGVPFTSGMGCWSSLDDNEDAKHWVKILEKSEDTWKRHRIAQLPSGTDTSEKPSVPMMAQYMLFLGKGVTSSYHTTHLKDFIPYNNPLKVIKSNSQQSMWDQTHLTVNELAEEWFAITHLDAAAGEFGCDEFVGTSSWGQSCNAVWTRENQTPVTNLQHFRKKMKNATPEWMSTMCSCASNPHLGFDPEGANLCTPLSAFIEGLCINLRKAWCSSEIRPIVSVASSDGSKSPTALITNVYSGVYTDLSPVLGSENDTGRVFPMIHREYPGVKTVQNALHESEEEIKCFTDFIKRVPTSGEQTQFAPRPAGSTRWHTMVIETNILAKTFLNEVNADDLKRSLLTLFIQNIILGYKEPACAFDEDALQTSRYRPEYKRLAELQAAAGAIWNATFSPGNGDAPFSLTRGDYCENEECFKFLDLTTRQDSDGRLYFIFSMAGYLVAMAKLIYRFRATFPLASAYIMGKIPTSASTPLLYISEDLWKTTRAADLVLESGLLGCYDGTDGFSSLPTPMISKVTPLFLGWSVEQIMQYRPWRKWFVDENERSGHTIHEGHLFRH